MKLKRFAAIFLALVLALSLSTVAFAAGKTDTGSITITDNGEAKIAGKTFNAYQLFKVTAASDNTATGESNKYGEYEYAAEWVKTFFTAQSLNEKTATEAAEYVSKLDAAGMKAFADAAKTYVTENKVTPSGTATAGANETKAIIGNLPVGYYIVVDTAATSSTQVSACMITYNDKNPEIDIKAATVPVFQKEVSNGTSYENAD